MAFFRSSRWAPAFEKAGQNNRTGECEQLTDKSKFDNPPLLMTTVFLATGKMFLKLQKNVGQNYFFVLSYKSKLQKMTDFAINPQKMRTQP